MCGLECPFLGTVKTCLTASYGREVLNDVKGAWVTTTTGSGTLHDFVVTGLAASTFYEFKVAAKNKAGTGAYSGLTAAAQTLTSSELTPTSSCTPSSQAGSNAGAPANVAAPDAPKAVKIVARTTTTLTATWTVATPGSGSKVTEHILYHRPIMNGAGVKMGPSSKVVSSSDTFRGPWTEIKLGADAAEYVMKDLTPEDVVRGKGYWCKRGQDTQHRLGDLQGDLDTRRCPLAIAGHAEGHQPCRPHLVFPQHQVAALQEAS